MESEKVKKAEALRKRLNDDMELDIVKKALELACLDACDEQCPRDFYDDIDWKECAKCIVGPNSTRTELRYDIDRDLKCWIRYYMEKARRELEESEVNR